MLNTQSPTIRRLLMFWLPLLMLILVAGYASQLRYNPTREAKNGLDRLNYWRKQAGVQPLTQQSSLHKAAQNHARYLTQDAHGHDERNRDNPHFTGVELGERTTAAGYTAPASENLTVGRLARSGTRSVDGLMTALYHRLSLLNPTQDEAGAAWTRGAYQAFVVVQGRSSYRDLCENGSRQPTPGVVLTLSCNNQPSKIYLGNRDLPSYKMAIKFPMGNQVEPVYDGSEIPNPMPQYKQTGNPISIVLHQHNHVVMKSFQLFAPDGEVQKTHILTASNDPNHLLEDNEFALFPIEPLAFDTKYRVKFAYRYENQDKVEEWMFKTHPKRHWLEF
ncbi:CAP domain-containing protein [Kingella kingae]|uniref:CAP domain-containing protein n=1 Tax=Kingella kingae TaxID=504 RepID=UPI0004142FEF|nr:CAP domain-containing protein [Kingella kingae]